MLTFSAIGYERLRFHKNPTSTSASSYVVSCCLWIVSCLIVLPYPVYTTYLDLGVSRGAARRGEASQVVSTLFNIVTQKCFVLHMLKILRMLQRISFV